MHPENDYTLIAKADYGGGYEVILYKTNRDQYFSTVRTIYGRTERIQGLSRDRAIETYQKLPIHLVSIEDAFPRLEIEGE